MSNYNTLDIDIDEVFGVGIASVEQTKKTTANGGVNEFTVTLTNGSKSVFQVCNGDGTAPSSIVISNHGNVSYNKILLSDLNAADWNKTYIIYNNGSGDAPANLPIEWKVKNGGALFTIDSNDNILKTQIFYSYDGHQYIRMLTSSGFSNWVNADSRSITVNKGEKISDAINKAKSGDTIYIKPGVYNPYSEGLTDNGYIIGKSLTIKADKGAIIDCTLPSENQNYSPLNVFNNKNRIEIDGLTIIAKNCRYCIHDELGSGANSGGVHIYKNLRLINNSVHSSVLPTPLCIGSGMTGDERIEVINCHCTNAQKDLSTMSFHTDYKGMTAESTVVVTGCVNTDGPIVTFSELSSVNQQPVTNTNGITAYVYNNLTKEKPFFSNGPKLSSLYEWNNVSPE